MPLPYLQNPLDWTTQVWNIAKGQRMDRRTDDWLLGPTGLPKEKPGEFISRIARTDDLTVIKNPSGAGLIDCFQKFDVAINPAIEAFYANTIDYELKIAAKWAPGFGSMGYLVRKLFSERIQQLNLSRNSVGEQAIESDITYLVDADQKNVYRVWQRRLAESGEVMFYGIYTFCQIPSGKWCLKAIFPLPRGSATVIFGVHSDADGNLELLSSGNDSGDPGFYFIVEDCHGRLWKNYLHTFRERIFVSKNHEGALVAGHEMTLWNRSVYQMHYQLNRIGF